MPRLFDGPTGDVDAAFVHKVQHQLLPSSLSSSAVSPAVGGGDTALRASSIYSAVHCFARAENVEEQKQQPEEAATAQHVETLPPSLAHALPPALARRGVGPKDPLLQRKLRKQQQQHQSMQSMSASGNDSKDSVSANIEQLQQEQQHALHWSRRPLSLMTSAGWDVFREQVGIHVEVVARRTSSQQQQQRQRQQPMTEKYTAEVLRPIRCWEEARLPLALGTVVSRRYLLPSSIQSQCVPLAMASAATASGKVDVLGVAETGSGKTAAYLIPLLDDVLRRTPRLLGNSELISHGPLALVAVPTRELADQVTHEALGFVRGIPAPELRELVRREYEDDGDDDSDKKNANGTVGRCNLKGSGAEQQQQHNTLDEIRVVKVVGGERVELQYDALAEGAHVVVGTLGQLEALLHQRLLALGNTRFVVLDEADRMIEEQQQASLVAVLERCPLPRQTIMLTATLNAACEEVALKYFSPDGFVVVRVPHRCSTITQGFELMPSDPCVTGGEGGGTAASGGREKESQQKQQQQQQTMERCHNPLLHPIKFARLVTYLAYAAPPIVVFANERRTCDALQKELRAEAAHLATLEESFSLETLVGELPPVLQRGAHVSQRRRSGLGVSNMLSVAVVHSEQSQAERRRLVDFFRRGERRVLLTTDLLARGLDVPNISLVVNYDMPRVDAPIAAAAAAAGGGGCGGTGGEDAVQRYIHRIGRTGRAGASGATVSFVCLPSKLIQRAQQHVLRAATGDPAEHHAHMRRLDMTIGASVKAVTHELDRRELTGPKGGHDLDEHLVLQPNEEEEEEGLNADDDDDDGGGGDGAPPQARRRVEQQPRRHSDTSPPAFPHDELLLQPLWAFLVDCAEANAEGAAAGRGADLIRQRRCRQLQLPSALVALMVAFTQRSPYGTITA